MLKVYSEHKDKIISGFAFFGMSLPEYKNLEWRLDVELSSRTVSQEAAPKYTLRLDLSEGSSTKYRSLAFHSDFANMKNLLCRLEDAAAEERGVHARRFQRYIR